MRKRFSVLRIVRRIIELYKKGILLKKLKMRIVFEIKRKNFKPFIIKKKFDKFKFPFYIGNLEGLEWYILNFESKRSYELEFSVKRIIKKGDTVFEVGSHHGFTTIILSKAVGDEGKVYAFETFPDNVKILRKNLEINNIKNVEIIKKAVGSRKGKIHIHGSDGINNYGTKKEVEVELINP